MDNKKYKSEPKSEPKIEKLIDLYHGTKHKITVKESLVKAHLDAGWRREK